MTNCVNSEVHLCYCHKLQVTVVHYAVIALAFKPSHTISGLGLKYEEKVRLLKGECCVCIALNW